MVNGTQQAEFTSAIEQEHKFEEHQRASKVEAETKMAEMSAEMHNLSASKVEAETKMAG